MTTLWTPRHLGLLDEDPATTAPLAGVPGRVLPGEDVWDMWPIQEEDGAPARVDGRELWMILSAPALGHPEERHDQARIRLLASDDAGWTDLGLAFADGASLGSREWSGSAVRRADGTVSVFYTAAGRRGEARRTFTQYVAEARPKLAAGAVLDPVLDPVLDHGGEHREILRSDGRMYLPADDVDGGPGRIRAFRDPGWFRDPADGREYLLVAASVPGRDRFMGAVALAGSNGGGWVLRPPLLVADGVNHEIERPHVVGHGGSYYLFFTTQRQSFHPPGSAPTGLYGFRAARLAGPYEPLNGSGLVIRNPPGEPDQAYGWWVLPDLRVMSFLNYRSTGDGFPWDSSAAEARAAFGGTIAPILRLALDGTCSMIEAMS